MFGIGTNELLLIILLMVIFIKPRDIPSVVNFIVSVWKKIKSFVATIQNQIKNITSEISETTDDIEETFHDKIEKLRLEIDNQTDLFDTTP
ncbi:MAG: hypothetical protein IJ638_02735, partial [Alphaproteobacteria bacterium]|nr:hypothetical protein [Alphaproteobacteria bacterium]